MPGLKYGIPFPTDLKWIKHKKKKRKDTDDTDVKVGDGDDGEDDGVVIKTVCYKTSPHICYESNC